MRSDLGDLLAMRCLTKKPAPYEIPYLQEKLRTRLTPDFGLLLISIPFSDALCQPLFAVPSYTARVLQVTFHSFHVVLYKAFVNIITRKTLGDILVSGTIIVFLAV